MEIIRIKKLPPPIDERVQLAREKLAKKLEKSLENEKLIANDLASMMSRKKLAKKLKKSLENLTEDENLFADFLGKKPNIKRRPLLDRFVKGVDAAYKTQLNIKALNIEAMKNILSTLQSNKTVQQPYMKEIKKLTIIYRNQGPYGVILPKTTIRNTALYYWELKSHNQLWTKIKEQNLTNPGAELVRLVYNGIIAGKETIIASNVINVQTAIKRQAFTAKRQQYRFKENDPEFRQRCFGVAHRILRLTTPNLHSQLSNGFSMRIFQDRVSRLPDYMDMDVQELLELCAHTLTNRENSRDENYIKMVEFCEPTIHLNPAALRRKLKKINLGHYIQLKLDENNSDSSDSDSSDDSSSDDSGDDSVGTKFDDGPPDTLLDLSTDESEEGEQWVIADQRPAENSRVMYKGEEGLLIEHKASWNVVDINGKIVKVNGFGLLKVPAEPAGKSSDEESGEEAGAALMLLESSDEESGEEDKAGESEDEESGEGEQWVDADQRPAENSRVMYKGEEGLLIEHKASWNVVDINGKIVKVNGFGLLKVPAEPAGKSSDEESGEEAGAALMLLESSDEESGEEDKAGESEDEESGEGEQWVDADQRPTLNSRVMYKGEEGLLTKHNGSWNYVTINGKIVKVNGFSLLKVPAEPAGKTEEASNQTESEEEDKNVLEESSEEEEDDSELQAEIAILQAEIDKREENNNNSPGESKDNRIGVLQEQLVRLKSMLQSVPSGELTAMLMNMSDDWAESDEELNFAPSSVDDDMSMLYMNDFAMSSGDEGMEFATSSSDEKMKFATSSGDEGMKFATSSSDDALKFATSSSDDGLKFADSSSLDFATSESDNDKL